MEVSAVMPQTQSLSLAGKTQEPAAEKIQEPEPQKIDGTDGAGDSEMPDPKRYDTFEKSGENADSDMSGLYHKDEGEKVGDKKVTDTKCTVNTDKVDAEIKQLQKEAQEIKRQLLSEENEEKRAELEQRLQSVESELHAKDNDSYRKQNAAYTYG